MYCSELQIMFVLHQKCHFIRELIYTTMYADIKLKYTTMVLFSRNRVSLYLAEKSLNMQQNQPVN